MATKVGEGYIEIKAKLVGFNRDLLRDTRARIREIEAASKEAAASISVKPKITGITKVWRNEVQQELNKTITGLTVDVKVRLDNGLKVTFGDFAIEAKDAGEKAADDMSKGFKKYIGGVHEEINKANIAIKSGFKAPDDGEINRTVEALGLGFRDLAEDIDQYSQSDVKAINRAVNSHKSLNNLLSSESKKATSDYEKSIENAIKATDRMVERINSNKINHDTSGVWNLAKSLNQEIEDVGSLVESAFPDLNSRIAKQGEKSGSGFSSAFGKALRSNFLDNASEGLLSLAGQFVVLGVSAQPLLGVLSNLSAGLIELGTIAVDLYGSFLALPAVWAAVAQAGTVLTAAMFGIQEALSAVMNVEQHAAANAAVQARQIADAQEQVADAKDRLTRAIESANGAITRSEEALAEAQISAARRIEDAQERIADANAAAAESIAAANKRIEDAQKALTRAYESGAERIASAEARHVDSLRRVKDAQDDLNASYGEALERFEDLNIALGNAILDEEGARIAIERAKERLDETLAPNSGASDLDKREAELAYREALQRLAEIEERQQDLKEQVDEANKSGVEGSKEVTDAKQALLDAQKAEIEAQADIAQAHKDSAQAIIDAQERVSEAQADAVKSQLDAAKRIQDAEDDLAQARADGAKEVQRAQEELAKAHKDSARQIADAQKDVKRAIEDLTTTQEKQNEQWFNAQYALSQLSPEAQKFVLYLADTFIPRLKDVQFAIQDAFFPPIQRALEQSGGLLDLFEAKLAVTAGIFGELIGQTIEWLEQPDTINQLGNIMDTNNELFKLLGEAGRNFGDVLLDVAEAAGPFLLDMGQLVVDFSKWLSDITNSKEGREELKTFFENVQETIHKVYDITILVGDALYKVYKMARPYGQELLDDIKDIAERFDNWVNSTEGQTDIEKFLKNGRDLLKEVFKLIEAVAKAFFEFGRDNNMADLFKSIREDLLPAVLAIIDALGGGNGGGGFIFLVKALAIGAQIAAANISLLAAIVSGIGAIFSGDWDGARDSFADFLDSITAQANIAFGENLPKAFNQTADSFSGNVRGMTDEQRKLMEKYDELGGKTIDWSSLTETTTDLTKTNFGDMATNVGGSMTTFRDDVDGKTKDAKAKAESNTKDTKEAITARMAEMQRDAAAKMEEYRKTVDSKTKDAKTDSSRNLGDLVKDAGRVMVPFSTIFEQAAKSAQNSLKNPGASWWDVGAAVIEGLWNGVKAYIPNFLTSIWNLGVDIINTINASLGINSPSRAMIATGGGIGEGLVIGIDSMAGKVSKASKSLASTVLNSFGNPILGAELNSSAGKVIPTIGASGINGVANGARNVNNFTIIAAPNVPTEKQISNVLKQQEALYNE